VKYCTPAVLWFALTSPVVAEDVPHTPSQPALEELGEQVFFDPISVPAGQACASCHVPTTGFTGASSAINLTQVASPGADPKVSGGRKPPTVPYASFSPVFGDAPGKTCSPSNSAFSCRGGLFLDGRATGTSVGDEVFCGRADLKQAFGEFLGPAADQALAPFANDVEMNVPDGADGGRPGAEFVCKHVQRAAYAELFELAWGEPIACDLQHVAVSFERIGVAISAWEHSSEVNSFSSKRDWALVNDHDDTPGAFPLQGLSDAENRGHDLFYGLTSAVNPSGKNAHCSACHNSEAATSHGDEPEQIYTDFRYHNIGVPANYEAAHFDPNKPDFGLSQHTDPEHVGNSRHDGDFRTPTVRNVDKRPSYGFVRSFMHNGYFKNIEDVVHFYNTATLKLDAERCPAGTTAAQARARDCWPAPQFPNGIPHGLIGDLGLTLDEEAALVAYLKTLTDQETIVAPRQHKRSHGHDRHHDHARSEEHQHAR
jgi:cytochrome c peroxidase